MINQKTEKLPVTKVNKNTFLLLSFHTLGTLTLVQGNSVTVKCSQDGLRQGDSLALCVLIRGTVQPRGGTDAALTCHDCSRCSHKDNSCHNPSSLQRTRPWNFTFTGFKSPAPHIWSCLLAVAVSYCHRMQEMMLVNCCTVRGPVLSAIWYREEYSVSQRRREESRERGLNDAPGVTPPLEEK